MNPFFFLPPLSCSYFDAELVDFNTSQRPPADFKRLSLIFLSYEPAFVIPPPNLFVEIVCSNVTLRA